MKRIFALTAALALLSFGIAAQAVTIATVPVGNVGNKPDTRYDYYGSVGYNYNIGKYEVTAGQYTEFLNAVATGTDPYGLYSSYMWSNSKGCKIQQTGAPGNYTYTVASAWANRPVNFVSYWDSLRFANWLNNGQGTSSTETGAYTLTADGIANNTIARNTGAMWAVTSEDEWYKAAYYDPDKVGGAGYWDYPTRTNIQPFNTGSDGYTDLGNHANYYNNDTFTIGSPYYRTIVGEFENSASAYGTFDQGGNVWEWNEAKPALYPLNRYIRGGSFHQSDFYGDMLYWYRGDNGLPTAENINIGFRVSEVPGGWQAVPEPSSILAMSAGLISLLGIRRRRA